MPTTADPNGAPADHRAQAFVASWVWTLPSPVGTKGLGGALLGGWQMNGIWSMYSGAPLAFATSQDRALRGQPNRPDRLKDARMDTGRGRADLITQYFDRTAYVPNQTGQFGNAPRAEGQLQAPGRIDVTAGILKSFRGVRESHSVQFRTELFNAFNRPNFAGPGTNPDTPGSFGRIQSAADGRIIQFGLKYLLKHCWKGRTLFRMRVCQCWVSSIPSSSSSVLRQRLCCSLRSGQETD